MANLFYTIEDHIFKEFNGYCRGVVLAFGVKNCQSPPSLIGMLRDAEADLRRRTSQKEIAAHPRLVSWREAYRSFGAKPTKYRSSIEAMVRRVVNNNEIPSINAIVDIGNILSLRHLTTVGGHAIDEVTQDIELKRATGEEEFIPFGSDAAEHPLSGEIIFTEGKTVLTRRWSWRQANHTLTLESTKDLEMNIDGLPPVPRSEVEETCNEAIDMISQFCGGNFRYEILTENNPRIELTI